LNHGTKNKPPTLRTEERISPRSTRKEQDLNTQIFQEL